MLRKNQNHVKGSEHEAIRVDGERVVPDVDAQTLQHDSGSGSYIDVPKIMGGTRIQQGEEAGTVDDDRKLHRASRVRLYAVERVHRDCQITIKLALFVRVGQLLRYLDHEQVLATPYGPARRAHCSGNIGRPCGIVHSSPT
jgi:hypothetical protein